MSNIPQADLKSATSNDVPDGIHRAIAEAIGVENLIALSKIVGGRSFYIMKPDTILKELRNKNIINDFTGYNYGQLAQKYDISERWVRKVIKRHMEATNGLDTNI